MSVNSYRVVAEDFYNLLKDFHERIYKGKFVHLTQDGREFVNRGYKTASNDPVEILAFYDEIGGYRMRTDIIEEINRLNELIEYRKQ